MKARDPHGLAGLMVLVLVALPLPYILRFDHTHAVTAAILGMLLVGITLSSRTAGVVSTLLYLIVLGDYRRYAGYFQGYPANDPLLLVAPLAAFLIACLGFLDGRGPSGRLGSLCFMVGMLAAMMTAQIFNPAQGGLEVGIAGALFYFVPLLWFWIGRVYGDARTVDLVLFRALIPLGVAAAALGLYQSLRGLLPFEAAWVDATGYGALYVSEEVVRAIGFFNSGSEYTRFLLIVMVTIVAVWLTDRKWWLLLLLPLLLGAMFLASSRGPIVFLVLTSVVLWTVMARRAGLWPPRFVLAAVLGVSLMTAALIAVKATHLSERSEVLVSHQVEGLLDPTNPEKSTAVGHLALGAQAVLEGFTSPAGQGLGSTTLAANKFGRGGYSAEMDFANMFYSLGFLGGFLYLGVLALALARAVWVWQRLRTRRELAMLGILIATLTAWMLGGEYSITAIVWFVIGATDRSHAQIVSERQRAARHAYRLGHT